MFRVSFARKGQKQPWQFSVIQSLKFAKGTKGLHKNGDSYGRLSCAGAVYLQSFQEITWQHLLDMLNLTIQMACTWFQLACFRLFFFSFVFQLLLIMYIAPCVKRRKMSQILVFNNAVQYLRSCKMYPLYRNLQHVVYQDWMGGTQWHSTDI